MKTIKTHLVQIFLLTLLFVFVLDGNIEAKGNEVSFISGLEVIKEPVLEVENWMINDNCWLVKESAFVVETDYDKSIAVEAWMLDNNRWLPSFFEYTSTKPENSLKLEKWMTESRLWN